MFGIKVLAAPMRAGSGRDADLTEAALLRLTMMLYPNVAATVAGMAVIAVLTLGYGTVLPVLLVAWGGLVMDVPVSWTVARAPM